MPLSEYEQRVLDELEQQLASEDPKLGSKMSVPSAPRRSRIALGVCGVIVGLAALVVGLVVSLMWVSITGFLVMFAGAYWAFSTPKHLKAASTQPGPGKARRSKLSERFEKRWEDRS